VLGAGRGPAVVAGNGASHAPGMAEHGLDAPEAAARENRGLETGPFVSLALRDGCIEHAFGGSGGRTGGQRESAGGDQSGEPLQTDCGRMCAARITAVIPKPKKKERKKSGLNRPMGSLFHIVIGGLHRSYSAWNYQALNVPSDAVHIGSRGPTANRAAARSVAEVAHAGEDHRQPGGVGG